MLLVLNTVKEVLNFCVCLISLYCLYFISRQSAIQMLSSAGVFNIFTLDPHGSGIHLELPFPRLGLFFFRLVSGHVCPCPQKGSKIRRLLIGKGFVSS